MPGRERFGDRLRRFRESKGLSQRALSQKARVTQPTIAYLESGRRASVSLESARRIADALGISLDRLVGDSVIGDAEEEEEESLAFRA
jgi:transcriptional regulator with XRE-family HTH domain